MDKCLNISLYNQIKLDYTVNQFIINLGSNLLKHVSNSACNDLDINGGILPHRFIKKIDNVRVYN
ncbi:hypothetical protein KUTeg_024592 [Tegillarca granosa]|uniref:Uncharacterized protein n=1 Tax=Tegillarca granosa TaxID=220873 RepID=A0ABQ9E2W8_TEGGR|nr:hypothetical protein KUTeg_024592 [Tegillarca granosa]